MILIGEVGVLSEMKKKVDKLLEIIENTPSPNMTEFKELYLEELSMPDSRLSLLADISHSAHALERIFSLSSLSGQHNTISSIQNSISNIRAFSPGGPGLLHHRLQHLSSADHRLSNLIAARDHALLGQEDLLRRNLNSKITSGNHDSIRGLNDIIEISHALLVLDLGDDLDVLTLVPENSPDFCQSRCISDERSEDHVHFLLNSELQVRLVLLGDCGKIHGYARKIHTFAGTQSSTVLNRGRDLIGRDCGDNQGDQTVVHEDTVAHLEDLGDVFVVHPDSVGVALLRVGLVRGKLEALALYKLNLGRTSLET